MPANLGNSAVHRGLENVSFHSNPKEGQFQRMFKVLNNCTHFTCYAQNPSSYMNWEFPDVQAGFRKRRGIKDQTVNIHWITKKASEFQKNICFIDYAKALDSVDHNKLWEIHKEKEIPDQLTCLLRSLYAGQEATVRTLCGTTDWFKIVTLLYAEYIKWNARLDEAQTEIILPGEISINHLCRWHHPYGRKRRGTKEPLDGG